MRFILVLLFLVSLQGCIQADPPEIDSPSPDLAWIVTARWVKGGRVLHDGYDWDLRDVKTGKIYFHDDIQDNDIFPRRFDVLWSPDSHYAALTLYYGRAMQGTNILCLSGVPASIEATLTDSKIPLEKTLLHREDLNLFTGYNRLLTGAERWINNTDLSVELDMLAYLEDRKSGQKYTLNTIWHKTVRFHGKSSKVIASTCDSYLKTPDPK